MILLKFYYVQKRCHNIVLKNIFLLKIYTGEITFLQNCYEIPVTAYSNLNSNYEVWDEILAIEFFIHRIYFTFLSRIHKFYN